MKCLLVFLFSLTLCIANAQTIITVAGNGSGGYSGDGGAATLAQMNVVPGVAADGSGNIYITEYANSKIRKVSGSGMISTIAGTTPGYGGDGGHATSARIFRPSAIMVDPVGNIIFSDCDNHRVRKINPSGIITTIAGNGIAGYSGDGGAATAAQLYFPEGLAMDTAGNLYVADFDNNRVRKITPSGIITTIAGTGVPGYSGDGGAASSAKMQRPYGVAISSNGDIYVSDYFNHAVRKIDISGIITTIAGTGVAGYSGDGGAATSAQFNLPKGIALDRTGNLLVTEFGNHTVRKIDVSGTIYTIAGNHTVGYSGDGGSAINAQLAAPENIAVDLSNNVFIADHSNNVVRKIQCMPVTPAITVTVTPISAIVGTTVTVAGTVSNAGSSYLIRWMNKGIEFATTSVPFVTYVKLPGTDTITARVVPLRFEGCADSAVSAGHVVIPVFTSVASYASDVDVTVYPNPVNDELHIMTGNLWSQHGVYKLLNVVGSVSLQGILYEGRNDIFMHSLPPGVYILEVIIGKQQIMTRIIRQ